MSVDFSEINKPCIFASNHDTFYDGPALLTYLQYFRGFKTAFITKEEIVENNFIWRFFINKFQHVVVERDNPARAVSDSVKLLKRGLNLIIFPEGTTKGKRKKQLLEGRTGVIRISIESNSPIIPVGINYYGKRRPLKIINKINFGEPIQPLNFNNYQELRDQVDRVMENIAQLSDNLYKKKLREDK